MSTLQKNKKTTSMISQDIPVLESYPVIGTHIGIFALYDFLGENM